MIKLLRHGAIERPWFLRILIFLIAVAFVIGMGWGFGSSDRFTEQLNYVAKIDDLEISKREYRRTYQNAYRTYREALSDSFTEENLKKLVINEMISRRLWLKVGNQLELDVSPHELARIITKDRSFYRKGRFDSEQYRFILSNSRPPMTPEQYESILHDDLLIEKTQDVIRDGITLTTQETEVAKATVKPKNPASDKPLQIEAQAVRNALNLKKRRALSSFLESARAESVIVIQDWQL